MKTFVLVACALSACATIVSAQQPPPPRTRADSLRAKQIADSIALVRELEGQQQPAAAQPPQQGSTNPRMLPDFSAVGDLLADLSPDRSTQEDDSRFGVREVELAVQAVVDPFFRGDVFLGISDGEGASIEQAFLTTTSLPYGLQLRLGRYLMPFGKQNTTHRHDLHTTDYPYVVQRFFGAEGLKGTGVELSRIFAPFGFYQELIATVVDRLGGGEGELHAGRSPNEKLSGLGYTVRLRNYWDLSQSTNLELSFSGATARVERPLFASAAEVNAALARQSHLAGDLTFRWRPLQQGLYRSLILQAEVMRQFNAAGVSGVPAGGRLLEPQRDYTGGYAFARYQVARRGFLGARFDWLEDPQNLYEDGTSGRTFRALSGYYEFFPSEFSKINTAFERTIPTGSEAVNRLLVQATFAVGPHKPHPF